MTTHTVVSLISSSSCQATVDRKIDMKGGSGRQSDGVRYTVTNANLAPHSSAIPLIGYPETLAFVH